MFIKLVLLFAVVGRGTFQNDLNGEFDFELLFEPKSVLDFKGQVAGVAASGKKVVVFQRGNHSWEGGTFDAKNNYLKKNAGPITEDPIVELNSDSLDIIKKWGKDKFYLPHGITLDKKGNYWVTDAALHQVMKFDKDQKLLMTLGDAFKPGTGKKQYCKPTDVAVSNGCGCFFISDGYCNSRVLKYDKTGKYLATIGEGDFNIPHSLALLERKNWIAVADRENSRILIYHAGLRGETKRTGEKIMEIKHQLMGRVYAIAYDEVNDLLHAVTGKTENLEPTGLTFSVDEGELVDTFVPNEGAFDNPHDLAVCGKEGENIFVTEIGPNRLWKFGLTKEPEFDEEFP